MNGNFNQEGLVPCLRYPVNSDSEYTTAKETLELAVCIQTLNDKGEWASLVRVIHLNPRDEGRFDVVIPEMVKEKPPMLLVETQFLEEADHAHHRQ